MTEVIALHRIGTHMMADYAIDCTPAAVLTLRPYRAVGDREDPQEMAEVLRTTHAFAAPYALHFRRSGDINTWQPATGYNHRYRGNGQFWHRYPYTQRYPRGH